MSARVVTIAEVEERYKEEKVMKTRSIKANQLFNMMIDLTLLQRSSASVELVGDSEEITNILRIEDIMGVFNYLVS